jgi:hypothetical protein
MRTGGKYFYASLSRISDLAEEGFELEMLDQDEWATGDYVVGEVISRPSTLSRAELRSGRMIELVEGDLVVGAWGTRAATLEAVGSWRDIGDDGQFHAMTSAGLFGKVTSLAPLMPPVQRLQYRGHTTRDGRKLVMRDFVPPIPDVPYDFPTVLIIGTSMSAGKTTSAKRIIRHLKGLGLRVVGCKLTGAGRYRDVLAMWDSGADAIYDFVDVGLPSTVTDPEYFRARLGELLRLVAGSDPDIVVAEAGASPLEPYNGEVVLQELGDHVKCTVLCASDPYAVAGVSMGFGYDPDVVAGIATNTSAAVELIKRLTGQPAFSFLSPGESDDAFDVIRKRLGL